MRSKYGYISGIIVSPTQLYHFFIQIIEIEGMESLTCLSTDLSTDGVYYSRLDNNSISTVDEIVSLKGHMVTPEDEDTTGLGGNLFRIKLQKHDTCWPRFNFVMLSGNMISGYSASYTWVTG